MYTKDRWVQGRNIEVVRKLTSSGSKQFEMPIKVLRVSTEVRLQDSGLENE